MQFPIKLSQHHDKTTSDHLGLNYVTERILASVLPQRIHHHQQQQQKQQQKRDNEFNEGPPSDATEFDESPQDIYEQELISMLEQKHGKVNKTLYTLYTYKHISHDCIAINQLMESVTF